MKIPFDIKYRPQIESGEYKVETRDGKHVRILCYDANNIVPIVALVTFNDGSEGSRDYYHDGTMNYSGKENPLDLFIIIPEKELTEFERRLVKFYNDRDSITCDKDGVFNRHEVYELLHSTASELLSLAREQFIKDGYVIEKKAFHDAVEKIDDKHKAEMSIEYSLHCKVENRTRHAVMNWDTFQKVAQKFINIGKDEALKDLPRWKKIGQGDNYWPETEFRINGRYLEMNDNWNSLYEISLKNLEKLPKEDEK